MVRPAVSLTSTDWSAAIAAARALLGTDALAAAADFHRLADAVFAAGDDALAARLTYLRAQATAASGDVAAAVSLVDEARNRLAATDQPGAALRTGLGRAHLLNEMGRHDEAAGECEAIIRAVAGGVIAGGVSLGDLDEPARSALAADAYQNLGLCHELRADWSAALEAYGRAESLHRSVGDDRGRGEVANNRAAVLLAVGRITEAEEAFGEATAALADDPALLLHPLAGLAELRLTTGDFQGALVVLGRASELVAGLDLPLTDSDRSLAAARAYEALNLHVEALAAYQEAAAFCAGSGLVVKHARAEWGRGRVLLASGATEASIEALGTAIELFRSAGQRQLLAGALVDRAAAWRELGHPNEALRTATEASVAAEAAGAVVEEVRAEAERAMSALAGGAADLAEVALGAARQAEDRVRIAPLQLALDALDARLALHSGDLGRARASLERAAAGIERAGAAIADVVLGRRFAHDKIDVFDALIGLEVAAAADGGDVDGTPVHLAVERARRQRLGSLRRRPTATDGTAATTGRFVSPTDVAVAVSAQRELDAVYAAMLRPADDLAALDHLRRRATQLESEISRARLTVVADAEAGAIDASTPAIMTLNWFVLDAVVYVLVGGVSGWVGPVAVGRLDAVIDAVERLDIQWQHLHDGFADRHLDRLTRRATSVLGELYDLLIRPIAGLLETGLLDTGLPENGLVTPSVERQAVPLVVSPSGVLHRVPFHALFDGERFLVERFDLSITPSVGDFLTREQTKEPASARALVLGAADETTPAVWREAHAVVRHLSHVTLHNGVNATAQTLRAEAPGAAIVHIAGHALFRRDNPMFSSVRLADRWFLAHEFLDLDLSGALVVLSACESARGDGHGEEVAGLTRAILGAGARTLVASLWPADDEATADLMGSFYSHLSTLGPSAALRAAQLDLITRRPHPYHWAPFVSIGGR